MYIRHNNLIILAISNYNSNVLMVFAFLYKLVEVLTEYFTNYLTAFI